MRARHRISCFIAVALGTVLILDGKSPAGSHTWDVNEVFSNADGTIQFIELKECCGGNLETGVNGHSITSLTRTYVIPPPALPQTTGFRHLLFATPDFAALPGAPAPDYVFPVGSVPFFSTGGDTIRYTPWDTLNIGPVPTDGVNSLNRDMSTGCNTPTNFDGQTGSVNVGCTTLGDVDGSGSVNGGDIPGFIRALIGSPEASDNTACAEYCLGNVADTVNAFVADILS